MMTYVVFSFPQKNIQNFIKAVKTKTRCVVFSKQSLSDHLRKMVKHAVICYANHAKNCKQNPVHESANLSFESIIHVDFSIGSVSQTNLESLS